MRWEVVDEATGHVISINNETRISATFLRKHHKGFWLFKLGDPNSGWFPDQAEMDFFNEALLKVMPHIPYILYHYGIQA